MSEARETRDVLVGAARALGKVDHHGPRGLTLISLDELECMAIALVILGLVAIPPGAPVAPAQLVVNRLKEF